MKEKTDIWRKGIWAVLALSLCLSFLAGCGCGKKKETDAASQEVLKITITPEPSPTTAPEELDKAAVVTNGNMTMVNEYLAGKSRGTAYTRKSSDAAGNTYGDSAEDDLPEDGSQDSSEEGMEALE